MVEKKTKAADAETSTDRTAEELAAALEQSSNWEFIDRVPSPGDVRDLLKDLPAWWGVKPVDYLDYVQALPSEKKIQVPVRSEKTGGTRKEPRWFSVVTLYFSVAGRLQMCREAQEQNGWRVDFTPEPNTPSGVPGFIDLGADSGRIVYREYVEIWEPLLSTPEQAMRRAVEFARAMNADQVDDPNPMPQDLQQFMATPEPVTFRTKWIAGQEFACLGRRPGMAWVPYTGGSQAKGSNPFEKVETASRGRALAAWGFGVLPGSGVASYEEMLGVPANRQGIAGETGEGERPANGGPQREKPEELIAQILTMAEEARQIRGEAEGWNLANVREYVRRVANVDVMTVPDQDGMPAEIDLKQVKPAALLIVRNGYRERLAKLRDDAEQGN